MRAAAADLEFEEAARLRDEIKRLEALDLGLEPPPVSSATSAASATARRSRWGRAAAATIRRSGAAAVAGCGGGGHKLGTAAALRRDCSLAASGWTPPQGEPCCARSDTFFPLAFRGTDGIYTPYIPSVQAP